MQYLLTHQSIFLFYYLYISKEQSFLTFIAFSVQKSKYLFIYLLTHQFIFLLTTDLYLFWLSTQFQKNNPS